MFENKFTQNYENITQVHNSIVEIRDGLFLAGFGGSVPSFYISPPEMESMQAWKGYPHSSDELYGNDLAQFMENIKEEFSRPTSSYETPRKQLILMTHNGPAKCESTLFQQTDINSPKIISGSDVLRNIVEREEIQLNCLCHIHGHTHLFRPCSTLVGKLPIVNPGSLMEGNFAVVQLERQLIECNQPFLLESVNLYRFKP